MVLPHGRNRPNGPTIIRSPIRDSAPTCSSPPILASVTTIGHAFGLIAMILAVPAVTVLQEIAKLALERRRFRAGVTGPHPGKSFHIQPYVC